MIYKVGGRAALLGVFVAAGIAIIAGGVMLWRSARHRARQPNANRRR